MDPAEVFEGQRGHLVKLAYRMLGARGEADDVVQDAFLRWRDAGEPELRSPRAWLTRTATRLCLDRLRARGRNPVAYVGDELPEPLLETEASAEIDESLSMALLATVQRLKPAERAVFLLHDVFGYPFDEVGAMLDRSSAGCRQLAVRARKRLEVETVRGDASPEEVERLTGAFFAAVETGDLEGLTEVLSAEVVLRSDGGGKAAAAGRPIGGRDAVLRFLQRVLVRPEPSPVRHRRPLWFNGAPGVLVTDARGRPETAFQFLVVAGRIRGIYAQRNPDKLAGLR